MEHEKYRTPSIEEFVQGFEFEMAAKYNSCIIDLGSEQPMEVVKSHTFWTPVKVWWKTNPKERIVEKDEEGNTWDYSGELVNFFKPFDEQYMIDQKLVRVKIK